MGRLGAFRRDESGATVIEYGLVAAMIAVTVIVAFMVFGNNLVGLFDFVATRSGNAMGS